VTRKSRAPPCTLDRDKLTRVTRARHRTAGPGWVGEEGVWQRTDNACQSGQFVQRFRDTPRDEYVNEFPTLVNKSMVSFLPVCLGCGAWLKLFLSRLISSSWEILSVVNSTSSYVTKSKRPRNGEPLKVSTLLFTTLKPLSADNPS
jgi:hypothetical protein